jgi:hypothetical protein
MMVLGLLEVASSKPVLLREACCVVARFVRGRLVEIVVLFAVESGVD